MYRPRYNLDGELWVTDPTGALSMQRHDMTHLSVLTVAAKSMPDSLLRPILHSLHITALAAAKSSLQSILPQVDSQAGGNMPRLKLSTQERLSQCHNKGNIWSSRWAVVVGTRRTSRMLQQKCCSQSLMLESAGDNRLLT